MLDLNMFEECLYFNTNALARLLDKLWSEAFYEFNLTPSQGFMLRVIGRNDGINAHALANILVISRPTASRALDILEKRGLIKRKSISKDGREINLFLANEAKNIVEKIDAKSAQITKKLKENLGENIFKEFVETSKIIKAKI